MTKLKKIVVFKCPDCGMEHRDVDDMLECCSSELQVLRYECPQCADFWETEAEARACCKESGYENDQ